MGASAYWLSFRFYDDLDRLQLDLDRSRLQPGPRDVDPQLFDETPNAKQHQRKRGAKQTHSGREEKRLSARSNI